MRLNQNQLSRYAYVLNNPLKYTDPSGYTYNKPTPLDRDRRNGRGTYYNYELANSVANITQREQYDFYDNFTWVEGTEGSGWVRNSDIHTVYGIDPAFVNFFDDLAAEYGDESFTFSLAFGYGNMWIVGNSSITKMKSSFSALNDANFMNFRAATVFGRLTKGYLLDFEEQFTRGQAIKLSLKILMGLSDAVSLEVAGKASAVSATSTTPIGVLAMLRGKDRGKVKTFFAGSVGAGMVGGSADVVYTNYYIIGPNSSQVSIDNFTGEFYSIQLGADFGLGVGGGLSISSPFEGAFIIGYSRSIGVGKSPTIVNGEAFWGNLDFYSNY